MYALVAASVITMKGNVLLVCSNQFTSKHHSLFFLFFINESRSNDFLLNCNREIESTKTLDGNSLPEKFWFKVITATTFTLIFFYAISLAV